MNNWGNDDLSKFLDAVHSNQQANRANFAGPYAVISSINDCLSKAGKHLTNSKPVMAGIMLLRCQYAFKAAAGMALAGQVVEAFVMMRSVLEYAGYALIIFEKPELEAVFMNRHQSADELKEQKKKFNSAEIRAVISRFDQKLAENFDLFYQRAIDFGGHPNPHATFSAMKLEEGAENTAITAIALSTDPAVVAHAMKSVAQAGLTALYVFQHAFKEKFELLGVRAEIDKLRQHGGL